MSTTPTTALDPVLVVALPGGDVSLVRYAEGSYEDNQGRTYYSGATEPSQADAEAAVAVASAPPIPATPKKQSARTVLSRLTDTEYAALHGSTNIGIQRGLEAARIEGLISESDPDFPAFRAGCDALGIIAAARWDDLLAP